MAAATNPKREQLSSEIAALDMKPLWERVMRLAPGTAAVPAIWRWQQVQPHLMRSAEVITTHEAERRVLMLENPALKGSTFATTTLYAGLQIILPGEIARTHRHAPNALRLIVEGRGAYTAVEGERVTMQPGDFVTTPNWAWHDHGNLGSEPVVWLDGLDTAFANLFGAHFREDYPQETQPVSRAEGDAVARYGANLLPVDYRPQGRASPLLSYPYERTREALERLAKSGDPHPSHGHKLRYVNPATGGHAFPTMAVFMQWLPRGHAGRRYRSTDGAVFCVVEGRGSVNIGESRWDFAPHDVFVVPSWEFCQLKAATDCVLFSYTDRAAQEALGFWREESGT
ncbi:MAG TPA: gentisate 1,2-dioxygenase [Burkholderiales bacterium]|nr:gentisate 1,2-dioxygenase [Burkholderiales bacterium]